MSKNFTLKLFCLLSLVFIINRSYSQCEEFSSSWTFNPEPIDSYYEPGQTVEICTSIWANSEEEIEYTGIVPILPEFLSLDTATINSASTCGSELNWGWYESVTQWPSDNAFGPGFFYDGNGSGDPGNNWGLVCGEPITICFTVTIDSICNGNLSPDGNITPAVLVLSYELDEDVVIACVSDSLFPTETIHVECTDFYFEYETFICNTGIVDLFTILENDPDLTGTWTGPDGFFFNGLFDPQIHPPGIYTYSYINDIGNSYFHYVNMIYQNWGYVGNIQKCMTSPPFYLSDEATSPLLPYGGIWIDPYGNPVLNGIVTPATSPSGTYTYTFLDASNCYASAIVYVFLGQVPSTGEYREINVCSNDSTFLLIDSIGGNPDPGGAWIVFDFDSNYITYFDDDSALFHPYIDISGYYIYGQYTIDCIPSVYSYDTVKVIVNDVPNVGETASATILNSDPPLNLEVLLNGSPDSEYTWYKNGEVVTMPFNPSTGISGIYHYYGESGNCTSSSQLLLTILEDTGQTDLNQTIVICNNDPFNLFALIEENIDTTGTWTGPEGILENGIYPGGTNPLGWYEYIFTNDNEEADTLNLQLVYNTLGVVDSIIVCPEAQPFFLGTGLPPTINTDGEWYSPSGDPVAGGYFNPLTSVTGFYSYIFTDDLGCINSAQIYVNLGESTNGSYSDIIFCSTDTLIDLLDYLPENSLLGGIWLQFDSDWNFISYQEDSLIINDITPFEGNYFIYEDSTLQNCPNADTLHIVISPELNLGNNSTATILSSAPALNLIDLLDGSPDPGYTWYNSDGIEIPMPFDPFSNSTGIYYYYGENENCSGASELDLTIEPDSTMAGENAEITVYNTDPEFALFEALNGSPWEDGTWTGPSDVSDGMFDPSEDQEGVYYYTISGLWGSVQSTVTVNILNPIGLFDNLRGRRLSVYPNPVDDLLWIKGDFSNHCPYAIFNVLGKELETGTLINEEQQLNMSKLSSGIYLLKITEGNKTYVARFIKN